MIWAHYILQVNIYLTLFYCFYKLLLSKETYFHFNRIYLVASGILSLAIPFLRFEWFTRQEATQHIYAGVGQINMIVQNVSLAATPDEQFSWGKLIVLVYLAGVSLFVIKLIFQLAALKKILRGLTSGQAFSFLNKKVVDPALPGGDVINHHEDIHIKQLHTIDLIFFELLTIFIWFNPIIYFYKRTIRSIHEYLADERAAQFQGDKEQYALLLLSKAFQIDPHMLTNNFFNQSLIKRRIFMLHKQRSKKTAILKYGMFVPLFALTLVLSSATIRDNNAIRNVAEDLPLKETIAPITSGLELTSTRALPLKISLRSAVETDWEQFRKYLSKNVKYPSLAIEKNIQGNTLIKFTVSNGAVKDLGTSTNLGANCDAEAMKAILSYDGFKEIPDGKYMIIFQFRLSGSTAEILNNQTELTPDGYKKLNDISIVAYTFQPKEGNNVIIRGYGTDGNNIKKGNFDNAVFVVDGVEVSREDFNLIDQNKIEGLSVLNGLSAKAVYGLRATGGAIVITLKQEKKEEEKKYDYIALEVQPTFPGGMDKFKSFIQKTLTYPVSAMNAGISGTVNVSFFVEKDGSVTDAEVDRKVGGGLDEEAIRVISLSPKWLPGMLNGQPVRVKFSFPVAFKIDKGTTNKKN